MMRVCGIAPLVVAMLLASCGHRGTSTTGDATICDPGENIFCRCPGGEAGTKTCRADGRTFDPCVTAAGACTAIPSTTTSTGSGGAPAGCSAIPVAVSLDAGVSRTGDTTQGDDRTSASCGGEGAPELVYEVTPAETGVLVVTMSGAAEADPVLFARAADCTSGLEIACADATLAGGVETIAFPVTAGSDYFVIADGSAGTRGAFTLDVSLQASVPGDTCPGAPIAIALGDDVVTSGDTAIAGAHYKGADACATSASTKEIVYSVTPSDGGTLTVTLDPSYDGQLYARSGSCTTGAQIACSEAGGEGVAEQIAFAVDAGAKYSVFVDGQSGSAGAYTIAFHLGP